VNFANRYRNPANKRGGFANRIPKPANKIKELANRPLISANRNHPSRFKIIFYKKNYLFEVTL
jgi:hypothetical protein